QIHRRTIIVPSTGGFLVPPGETPTIKVFLAEHLAKGLAQSFFPGSRDAEAISRQPSAKGVDCAQMVGKRLAVFSNWVRQSKLRRFSALLVFWIVFDQLFGYVSHGILGWSRESLSH